MIYVALAALLIAVAAIWRVASVFHKLKQLTSINRSQRRVIDALVKANERQVKLDAVYVDIERARSAQDYQDIYSSIIS